jgi:hypothetical protein
MPASPPFTALRLRRRLLLLCFVSAAIVCPAAKGQIYDVVVYGESSAGVMAAVEAARLGKHTVLISRGNHVGGTTASGLGVSDTGDAATIGGLAWEFYVQVYRKYHPVPANEGAASSTATSPAGSSEGVQFDFEPHVAETVFRELLTNAGAELVQNEALDRVAGVARIGSSIVSIRMKSGRTFSGGVFIDATYEGDLLAAAGVPYRLGRESRTDFNESIAGVYRDEELHGEVDPYRTPGDPTSGLLPGVTASYPGPDGTGDNRVQQYNLRLCVTNSPANRIPFRRPETYDRADYELLRRRLLAHPSLGLGDVVKVQPLPNRKADINANASFSTDMAGDESTRWAEASDEERSAILKRYRDYTEGLFWFLVHDPAVPLRLRIQAAPWGLAADEFTDNDHFPWQLYVREARRMNGAYTLTQDHCDGVVVAEDSVALASYPMDSHKVTLFIDSDGRLNTEGYFYRSAKPWPISYRALVPKPGDGDNLLVPICVSATHVAFNSLRMEPVYMMLGHAVGAAAAIAIDQGMSVQNVPYSILAAQLRHEGQILQWPRVSSSALETRDEPDAPVPLTAPMQPAAASAPQVPRIRIPLR